MTADLTQVSPFDAIRRVRPDGSEYWSARELMPLMGYEKWERFEDAVERARTSVENSGQDADVEASRLREPSGPTRQMRTDFHLSRFAAYLVAMNGDPRKPEVAAAQAYFAVRTRQAETFEAVPVFDVTDLDHIERLAQAVGQAVGIARAERTARIAAEERVGELEPLAEEYRRFLDAGGALPMGAAAQILGIGRQTLFDWLRMCRVLQQDRRPYASYQAWFEVRATHYTRNSGATGVSYTTFMRPGGLGPVRRLLIRRGYLVEVAS